MDQQWGPIFNDSHTAPKKPPCKYGVPYRYGDAYMRMEILHIWVLIYIKLWSIFLCINENGKLLETPFIDEMVVFDLDINL